LEQFSIRISKFLEKIGRMELSFENESDIPEEFWTVLTNQKNELLKLRQKTGKDTLPPEYFF
jgi:hypothetical protein